MKKKKIIVINLGWEQELLLDKLSCLDLEIYGVHYNSSWYTKPEYKDVLVCDLRDLSKIMKYASSIVPDAVISDQCDYSNYAQAMIAEKFNLPGPRIKEAIVATNKYFQRILSRKKNLKIPEFSLCKSVDEARRFARRNGLPVILKPIDNRGSFGVSKINDEDEIQDAFYDAVANSHSRTVIAEDFIVGTHITVDGYVFPDYGCKSLALASKVMLGTERQVAIDIIYPGRLPEKIYDHAFSYSETVTSQLGYKFGFTHSEYMVTEDGESYLIESANRGGGVCTSEIIVPTVSGIDIVSQYIDDVLGLDTNLYKPVQRNQVILKFFSLESGKIGRIEGAGRIKSDPDILKFRLDVKEGDTIQPITTDANRHGFFILRNDGDIMEASRKTIEKLGVVYE